MKQILLMCTEIGEIPILICDRVEKDVTIYTGTILNNNSIHIQSLSKENCIIELKKAFELQAHFWLRNQLLDLNITYETSNKNNTKNFNG